MTMTWKTLDYTKNRKLNLAKFITSRNCAIIFLLTVNCQINVKVRAKHRSYNNSLYKGLIFFSFTALEHCCLQTSQKSREIIPITSDGRNWIQWGMMFTVNWLKCRKGHIFTVNANIRFDFWNFRQSKTKSKLAQLD